MVNTHFISITIKVFDIFCWAKQKELGEPLSIVLCIGMIGIVGIDQMVNNIVLLVFN